MAGGECGKGATVQHACAGAYPDLYMGQYVHIHMYTHIRTINAV